MSSYNYTISNFDFAVLEEELKTANLYSLFDYHIQNGTSITLFFTQALDAGQQTTLDTLEANHPCLKCQLTLYLADYRWQREISGTVLNGMNIPTDRESQSKLIAIRIKAIEDNTYTVDFKTPNGFVTMDATTCIAVADAAQEHVQACFTAESHVYTNIWNDTLTTEAAVEAEFESEYAAQ